MTNLLGLDPDFLQDLASYEIRPVRSTRSKVPNEVVVIFPDVDTRDSVRRSASNLAGNTGAGIRLEIPEFLRQNHRALESLCYMLKQKNPTLKRNIKFDDDALDLVLDIKKNDSSPWQKIRPKQAIEAKRLRAEPSREEGCELDSDAITTMLSEAGQDGSPGADDDQDMDP